MALAVVALLAWVGARLARRATAAAMSGVIGDVAAPAEPARARAAAAGQQRRFPADLRRPALPCPGTDRAPAADRPAPARALHLVVRKGPAAARDHRHLLRAGAHHRPARDAVRARAQSRHLARRARARQARADAGLGDQQGGHHRAQRRHAADGADRVRPEHRAGADRRRHPRPRRRLRRPDAGAGRHQRLLSDPRGPGSRRRRRGDQRRRRLGRGAQPAHDRPARRRRNGPRLPERRHPDARQPQQGLLLLRHRSRHLLSRGSRSGRRGAAGDRHGDAGRSALRSVDPRAGRRSRASTRSATGRWSSRCGSRPCR